MRYCLNNIDKTSTNNYIIKNIFNLDNTTLNKK